MEENFCPTHKVVKLEPGTFVFSVGTLLQSTGEGYYKSQFGHRKYVPDEYLQKITEGEKMNIQVPAQDVKDIMAALLHGSQSPHHPRCSNKKTNHCDCHVQKCWNALEALRKLTSGNPNLA